MPKKFQLCDHNKGVAKAMLDAVPELVEPLKPESSSRSTRFDTNVVITSALVALLGLAVLLIAKPRIHTEHGKNVAAQVPTVIMASRFRPLPTAVQRLQPFQGLSKSLRSRDVHGLRSGDESPDLRMYEFGEMSEFVTTTFDVQMPRVMYGTTGTKQEMELLTQLAVENGFMGVDAGGHRHEADVGAAFEAILDSGAKREDYYIQSKVNLDFAATFAPDSSIKEQVQLAINRSLTRLKMSYIDGLVLQSNYSDHKKTMEAWAAMEKAVQDGRVRQLGLTNVESIDQMQKIYAEARLKPALVQQSFDKTFGFDVVLRRWCQLMGIPFQAYVVPDMVVDNLVIRALALRYGVRPELVFMRFLLGLGVVLLSSPQNDEDMRLQVRATALPLERADVERIEKAISEQWPDT